ncbi:hypothetical protein BRDCF_p244 [Bacteroidales bacterium CF]|nr:hypothetical protein BRDCF_p244 [Bacteroidales bacterium CF]
MSSIAPKFHLRLKIVLLRYISADFCAASEDKLSMPVYDKTLIK